MALFTLKKSPTHKLRETKVALSQWTRETQTELDSLPEDELFRLDLGDSIAAWTAQMALIDELIDKLLSHPERCTAEWLEKVLREKFRVYDGLQASLANLPQFDEMEDELDYDAMTSTERIQRKVVHQYHERQFMLHHQCDLLARFIGVSDRRIHDVRYVISAHYQDEELRELSKKVEAATYYPLIKAWIDGEGTLKALAIPAKFSDWMTEYKSSFPVLI